MAGVVTSPQSPGVWTQFGAFVRHPVLPERASGVRLAALPVLGKLFALDLLLMGVLIGIAAGASALGLEMPEHLLDLVPVMSGRLAVPQPDHPRERPRDRQHRQSPGEPIADPR